MLKDDLFAKAKTIELGPSTGQTDKPRFFTDALAELIDGLPKKDKKALKKELGIPQEGTTNPARWKYWVDEAVARICFSEDALNGPVQMLPHSVIAKIEERKARGAEARKKSKKEEQKPAKKNQKHKNGKVKPVHQQRVTA